MNNGIVIEQPKSLADWDMIRAICCKTANSGQPIDVERWPFFGELWVGPYQKLEPNWTYVGRRGEELVGYLTGCPDSIQFGRARWLQFTLPTLWKIAKGEYRSNGDTRRFLRRSLFLDRGPEESFPQKKSILRDYPAHLHVNVDAAERSSGLGSRLLDRYCEDLQKKGVAGVHLFCGEMPLRFYSKNGFTELAKIQFRPGVWVFALGKKL